MTENNTGIWYLLHRKNAKEQREITRGLILICEGESNRTYLRTWLTETQQSDWSSANSIDHDVEKHVLKTIGNGLNCGLLSFTHLESFDSLKKILETLSFASCFKNFPFICQNISACLRLNRPRLAIV